jgi:hypothetical protein
MGMATTHPAKAIASPPVAYRLGLLLEVLFKKTDSLTHQEKLMSKIFKFSQKKYGNLSESQTLL